MNRRLFIKTLITSSVLMGGKMEIYKHKASGKYFINIQDTGRDEALIINPQCRILSLPLDSFLNEIEEGEDEYFLSKGLITEKQLERWRRYSDNRKEERRDEFINRLQS